MGYEQNLELMTLSLELNCEFTVVGFELKPEFTVVLSELKLELIVESKPEFMVDCVELKRDAGSDSGGIGGGLCFSDYSDVNADLCDDMTDYSIG